MTIQHLTPHDLPDLREFIWSHSDELNIPAADVHRRVNEWAQDYFLEPDRDLMLVARQGNTSPYGRVIGFVAVHTGRKRSDQHVGRLRLVVHEAYRGEGLGRRLLQEALLWADTNRRLLRLEATPYSRQAWKVAWFERNGFFPEGTLRSAAWAPGEGYLDVIQMARLSEVLEGAA